MLFFFLGIIDSKGFEGKYNFFYLPIDFLSNANCGYAFANLRQEEDVDRFMRALSNISLHQRSQKITKCVLAKLQGFLANVNYYRNSAMNRDMIPKEYKPIKFEDDGKNSNTARKNTLAKYVDFFYGWYMEFWFNHKIKTPFTARKKYVSNFDELRITPLACLF